MGRNWLPGFEALDDPQTRPFGNNELEARGQDVRARVAQLMVAKGAHGDRLETRLEHPDEAVGAPDVLEEQEPTAGSENPHRLVDRRSVVADRAQREAEHDRVE